MKYNRWAALLPFLLVLSSFGQKMPVDEFLRIVSAAEAKMASRHWNEAADLWVQAAKANPYNGRFWSQAANAYLNAKDYKNAIPAYEKQIQSGYGIPSNAAYNIACSYAHLVKRNKRSRG